MQVEGNYSDTHHRFIYLIKNTIKNCKENGEKCEILLYVTTHYYVNIL